jgi:hypothetical protein
MITERRFKRGITDITQDLVDEVERIYNEGLSMVEVAESLNISGCTVNRIFKLYGLKSRPRGENLKLYNKTHIGLNRLENCHNWKGGQVINGDGYIMYRLPPDDPHVKMARKVGYVMAHRHVMAKHLGRDLKPWEIVHHKNGDRKDNCIENLQLLADSDEHGKYTMSSHILAREVKKQEEQIREMDRKIRELEEETKQLRKRVTLVEAENVMMKMQRCVS